MGLLLDGFKNLPSEIRCDILVKIFHEADEQGNRVPPFLPALRGEKQLYYEGLSIYYSLTTIRLTRERMPAFLALSAPTKKLIRKMCLDIRLEDAIYHPQERQSSFVMQILEAASQACDLEEIHLIPRLTIWDPNTAEPEFHATSVPKPAGVAAAALTDLAAYLPASESEAAFNVKQTEKHIREILSDFFELKLKIVQKILSDFPNLRKLVVEPRLEDFPYFPDSFVASVNEWLGPARLISVGTRRRGDGEQWLWDLRGRKRIVRYE